MNFLKRFYEKEHLYLDKLNPDSRNLVKSITFFNLMLPLLGIFLTAFLFRQTQSQTLVGIFYIFFFFGITLGFYLNGILLKKFSSNVLLITGLISESLVFIFLVFYPSRNLKYIIIFGLLYGLTVAIYWANRNFLTLLKTKSQNRIYFSSLESLSKSISDIAIPLIIGAFLVGITTYTNLSSHDGYKILSVLMLFFVLLASLIAIRIKTSIKIVTLTIKSKNKNWKFFRFYNFSVGFLTIGTILLPPLMILRLVGGEGSLGTFQSIAALLSTSIVYNVAKSIKIEGRFKLLTTSITIGLTGVGIYTFTYSPIGVFAFMTSTALAQPFWWAYMSSMSYDLVEKQNLADHYASLCDREIFINSGRITSILLFLLLILLFSDDFALRFLPIAFAVFQILIFLTATSIEKNK